MQLAFNDGSHIVDNPALTAAARRRLGVGTLTPGQNQIAGIAATAATTVTSILVGLSVIGGPVGAAIAGLVGIGIAVANLFGGCGQTCVAATHIADQAGALIDQAYNYYMNSPAHYVSMQQAYLTLFDGTWNALQHACSDPALGAAGQRCISDRARGSCAYKVAPFGWQQDANGKWTWVEAGANGSGDVCWNSFVGRRDPVANDPTVVPDPIGAITDPDTGAVIGVQPPSIFSGFDSATMTPVLLIGGGILAAALLLGD